MFCFRNNKKDKDWPEGKLLIALVCRIFSVGLQLTLNSPQMKYRRKGKEVECFHVLQRSRRGALRQGRGVPSAPAVTQHGRTDQKPRTATRTAGADPPCTPVASFPALVSQPLQDRAAPAANTVHDPVSTPGGRSPAGPAFEGTPADNNRRPSRPRTPPGRREGDGTRGQGRPGPAPRAGQRRSQAPEPLKTTNKTKPPAGAGGGGRAARLLRRRGTGGPLRAATAAGRAAPGGRGSGHRPRPRGGSSPAGRSPAPAEQAPSPPAPLSASLPLPPRGRARLPCPNP